MAEAYHSIMYQLLRLHYIVCLLVIVIVAVWGAAPAKKLCCFK